MLLFFQELGMQIFLWCLQLVDAVTEMFTTFTGVTKVSVNGSEMTLLDAAMSNSTVSTVFWSIVVLAVGLCCVITIVAIIRNMFTGDKKLSGIVGKFIVAILATLAVLILIVLVILITDDILVLLADVFGMSTSDKLSTTLFDACVGKWCNGFSAADFDVSTTTVRDLLGDYKSILGVWPTSWKLSGMIDPDEFYYLPALIACVSVTVFMVIAVVQLSKRIFEIVFCYFTMPAALSVLPLDDGARFKNWRDTFMARILMVFGTTISVNVFAILLPTLVSVKIPGFGGFGNAVFMIVLIIAGAMVIPTGQRLFERIFVSREEAYFDGSIIAGRGARYITSYGRHMYRSLAVPVKWSWRQAKPLFDPEERAKNQSRNEGAYRENPGPGSGGTGEDKKTGKGDKK
ncbi:MAG: hypothetical protein LUD29_06355 [Clostridia bacterium]|nr:hypothetical protein [Clostridia bacterium]